MSGHSKWSKVKHQKASTDVIKAAAFTKATRGISVAVKEGGGVTDPNINFHLRLAIEKAHAVNMPKENIERAIEKAKGSDGESIRQLVYEAYGPYGIALYIEAATDNINRTVAFIKQTVEHAAGSMGSPGAVGYLFQRRGIICVPKSMPYDTILEIALELGAEDIISRDDVYELYTAFEALWNIQSGLEKKQIPIDFSSIIMQPKNSVSLPLEHREKVEQLVDLLETNDDIQHVYTTLD